MLKIKSNNWFDIRVQLLFKTFNQVNPVGDFLFTNILTSVALFI